MPFHEKENRGIEGDTVVEFRECKTLSIEPLRKNMSEATCTMELRIKFLGQLGYRMDSRASMEKHEQRSI